MLDNNVSFVSLISLCDYLDYELRRKKFMNKANKLTEKEVEL